LCIRDFANVKTRRKAKDRMLEKMVESGGFIVLRQLTLKGSEGHVKLWGINDPRAAILNKKWVR